VERAARIDARLASLEAPALEAEEPEAEVTTAPEPVPDDGAHAVGGGWYEVVVDGEMVEKVQGAEAAQEAYQTLRETDDGD
jgi:hypothetical protein